MHLRFLALLGLIWAAAAAEFHVAPNGNDGNPGTADQPFASLERAQQAARLARSQDPGHGVTVIFHTGRYALRRTIEFDASDSGASAEQPVRYQAEPGGTVILAGARILDGWQPDPQRRGAWRARAFTPGPNRRPTERFEQLWVNGRRATRARTPNEGSFFFPNYVAQTPSSEGPNAARHIFGLRPEQLAPLRNLDPAALGDVQIVALHRWNSTREFVQAIDPNDNTLTSRGVAMLPANPLDRKSLCYLENSPTALDAPGEWYLDREGWVTYLPLPDEDLAKAEVLVPRLDRFLQIQGDLREESQWVRHLVFEGLRFQYAGLWVPPGGLPPAQSALSIDQATIVVSAATNVIFRHCAVEHVGSTAVWFQHACRDCRLEHCRLTDLGISGVRIGQRSLQPPALRTTRITVDNCIIQSGGRLMPEAAGVWIGHNADNVVSHCDIADFYHTGVSVGWRWGYEESGAKRNRIEFNHIHHLGYGLLSDMGGVYTLGPSEGTIIRNNHIHDIEAAVYGGWGIYTDEGSSGILIENNVVHDVRDGGFHQHYGKDNVVRNNIFAFSREGQVALTRAEPHRSFTFERNIVIWDGGQLLGRTGWRGKPQVGFQNNLYWRLGGKPLDFDGQTWDAWRAGQDQGSIIADPQFADPSRRDFHLAASSPAARIGFQPIDLAAIGVTGDPAWTQLAASRRFPPPLQLPAPPSLGLKETFEQPFSALLSMSRLEQEGRTNLITVVDDPDPGRRGRCLKLQDAADLKQAFNPHLYWNPEYTEGPVRMAFSLRVEPGAQVQCEWRNASRPYQVGPSLHVRERSLIVGGRKLLDVPENVWIRCEIVTGVGSKANGQWSLAVTLPDRTRREFKGLACDPKWRALYWVGFMANAAQPTACYLDDVELENR